MVFTSKLFGEFAKNDWRMWRMVVIVGYEDKHARNAEIGMFRIALTGYL
jgi:hypothetical protein